MAVSHKIRVKEFTNKEGSFTKKGVNHECPAKYFHPISSTNCNSFYSDPAHRRKSKQSEPQTLTVILRRELWNG